MWFEVILGIIAFIPALTANSLAVISGGGTPMDFGRKLGNKRILGDGKTWRGFIGGGLFGGLIGFLIHLAMGSVLYSNYLLLPFALSFGCMFGDLLGSLVKRRMGLNRGENVPVLDQYDFVVGTFIVIILTHYSWTVETYFTDHGLLTLISLMIIVPVLHRGVNIIGYKMKMKKEPW